MMLGFLMNFVPAEYKALADMAKRMMRNLDTREEREAALAYFLNAQRTDGQVTVGEWAKFGSMLGVLGNPRKALK